VFKFCGLYFVICLTLLCFGLSRIENVDVFVYYKIPLTNVLQLLSVHYIWKARPVVSVFCSSGEINCYDFIIIEKLLSGSRIWLEGHNQQRTFHFLVPNFSNISSFDMNLK